MKDWHGHLNLLLLHEKSRWSRYSSSLSQMREMLHTFAREGQSGSGVQSQLGQGKFNIVAVEIVTRVTLCIWIFEVVAHVRRHTPLWLGQRGLLQKEWRLWRTYPSVRACTYLREQVLFSDSLSNVPIGTRHVLFDITYQ